jgi:hypothetical protein
MPTIVDLTPEESERYIREAQKRIDALRATRESAKEKA